MNFNPKYVQKDIDFINKCFDEVLEVAYDGYGNVAVIGKGMRSEPIFKNKGNAQLGSNLAKSIAFNNNLTEPRMQKEELNYALICKFNTVALKGSI